MEVAGVAVVVESAVSGRVLLFALGGVVVGTLTGLIPGRHANNFALFALVALGSPRTGVLVALDAA